jgi:hypothetical protein
LSVKNNQRVDIDGVGIQGTPYMKLMKEEEEKK